MSKANRVLALLLALTTVGCQSSGSLEPLATVVTEEATERRPEVPDVGCGYVLERPNPDRRHLPTGETFDYSEFPPAAGPHEDNWLPAGRYQTPLTDGPAGDPGPTMMKTVHSLEHGYVVVIYDEEAAAEADESALETWLLSADTPHKLIIIPSGRAMTRPIALVAWERLVWCADAGPSFMDEFVAAYREGPTAPEPYGP